MSIKQNQIFDYDVDESIVISVEERKSLGMCLIEKSTALEAKEVQTVIASFCEKIKEDGNGIGIGTGEKFGVEFSSESNPSEVRYLKSHLKQINIESEGSRHLVAKHCPTIYAIRDISRLGPMYYEGQLIKKFSFPRIGCDLATIRSVSGANLLTEHGVFGIVHSDKYVIGAREKIDGVSAMVFSISLSGGRDIFFFWDDCRLMRVDVTQIGFYEKKDGELYDLGYVGTPRYINGMIVNNHPFEFLSLNLISESKEGLMVLIDGIEYKLPNFLHLL